MTGWACMRHTQPVIATNIATGTFDHLIADAPPGELATLLAPRTGQVIGTLFGPDVLGYTVGYTLRWKPVPPARFERATYRLGGGCSIP